MGNACYIKQAQFIAMYSNPVVRLLGDFTRSSPTAIKDNNC